MKTHEWRHYSDGTSVCRRCELWVEPGQSTNLTCPGPANERADRSHDWMVFGDGSRTCMACGMLTPKLPKGQVFIECRGKDKMDEDFLEVHNPPKKPLNIYIIGAGEEMSLEAMHEADTAIELSGKHALTRRGRAVRWEGRVVKSLDPELIGWVVNVIENA